MAAARHSLTSIGELLIDTPGGDRVRLATSRTFASRPHRRLSGARLHRGASTSSPTCAGATSAPSSRRRAASANVELPARVPRRGARRVPRSGRPPGRRCWASAIAGAIAIFLLLQAAFGSWRLASLFFLDAAACPGRRSPRRVHRRRHDLARLAPRPLRGVRLAVRNGLLLSIASSASDEKRARRSAPSSSCGERGAADSDPDVSALAIGAGASAVRRSRRRPGHEIVAPDGRRRPGRPGHLDAVQPLCRACSLLAVRAEAETRAVPACRLDNQLPGGDLKVGKKW